MKRNYITITAVLMVIAVLAAACGNKQELEQHSAGPDQDTVSSVPALQSDATLPFKTDMNKVKEPLEISASKDKDQSAKGEPGTVKKTGEDSFDPDRPKLGGIALFEKKDAVAKKLGNPVEQYTIEDEPSMTIYEYDGLHIGFHKDDTVQFIEVSGADIATGLQGLQVGDQEQAAVKALGKPDSDTSFVYSYKAKDSLLKLDIDPKTETILSIKLFVVEESA